MRKLTLILTGFFLTGALALPARADDPNQWQTRRLAMEQRRQEYREKIAAYHQQMENLRSQMQAEMAKVRQIHDQMGEVRKEMWQLRMQTSTQMFKPGMENEQTASL